MKKSFLLLFIILPFFNYGQSNEILDFKPGYTPETIYNQTVTNSSDYEMTYSGSEKLLEVLKKNGTENPVKVKNVFNVETVAKTGKMGKDGNFPITIEYLQSSDIDGKNIIPNGTLLFGNATLSSMPKLDSIAAKGMEENLKNSIFQMVQSTFNQLAMPEKKLKAGESFSQESPLAIPLAGINLEMVITTTYNLKNITTKSAFFDIVQVYSMKISDTGFETGGSGNGTGKLVYNIPNHFISENTLDMELNLKLKHTDFNIDLISKSAYSQVVKISKK
ncbi:hypothetical protein SGQ44_14695 [Flavobacterium sp. Fl-77]|uniref:DUF3313 domain-containing protein n=1 Tax=Flavobacterium flavipigmentatum TaxID=2893884 RepID=A0AAJ2SGW0_9FLAO|nr:MULTISPECIES: hypothetical protein [unclassified Flavobacterium]MDX6181935.1 hypothetical protein [Flavobacterium sp. Fl-33]MDX6187010.1 hypothetical protein [Flavobacterium sp. Fl-77]UFH37143.1 hypothetical protein LNP22_10385 [Flavobacterium sp. F-70]